MMEPTTDPAAKAAPMAPCTTPAGWWKKLRYWSVPMMADIEEISKPNLERQSSATRLALEVLRFSVHSQHTTYRRDYRDEVGVVHFGEFHGSGLRLLSPVFEG